jgi:hypothetical protein
VTTPPDDGSQSGSLDEIPADRLDALEIGATLQRTASRR